ncbi:MAG TPA: hypothetical protein VJT84_10840 [Gaiellaceae bacterium]|nr:hypothetical protein [Gaiellaceae bacterium]
MSALEVGRTEAAITQREALAVIESRLGRAPQDMLEAAVVLEAWGGLRAEEALATAADTMSVPMPSAPANDGPVEDEPVTRTPIDALAMLLCFLTVVLWTEPLQRTLGGAGLMRALDVAVPAAIAFQWLFAARFPTDGFFRQRLFFDRRVLLTTALAGVAAAAAGGTPYLVGAELAGVWVATALALRARPVCTVLLLGALTAGLYRFEDARPSLGLAFAGLIAVLASALPRGVSSTLYRGRPWRVALPAGVLGLSLAALLLSDRSVALDAHARALALVLLPSSLAAFWGGWHMSAIWNAIPRALRGSALEAPVHRSFRNPVASLAGGALLRVVGTVSVLMPLAVFGGRLIGEHTATAATAVALSLYAVVAVGAALLDAIERTRLAVIAVGSGIVVSVVSGRVLDLAAGGALLAGTLVAAIGIVVFASLCLRRPALLLVWTIG